jgi:FkbM family methyltransferase
MNKIVKETLSDYLNDDGKLDIPSKAERILFDIGTSFAAPHSEVWTRGNDDVFVFAFEPNPICIESVKSGNWKQNPYGPSWKHQYQLDTKMLGNQVYLIEGALFSGKPKYSDFYCSTDDPGTSSLYQPSLVSPIKVEQKIEVPTFSLKEIFDLFPWDRFPFIEHVKVDAQSADYDVLLGMGDYIKKILYISVEAHTIDSRNKKPQYDNPTENPERLKSYIESNGFECKSWGSNGTFYNKNLREYWDDKENGFEYFFLNS